MAKTKNIIAETELILNADGSVYHLHLLPHQLATTVITVGDPDRVSAVSKYFDNIEFKVKNREFVTHTGTFQGKRLSVISTGIGTDNIDFVLNELDALVNIDLKTRTVKDKLVKLNIIRIGTSGCMLAHVPVNSIVSSSAVIGLDVLGHYYPLKYNKYETDINELIISEAHLPNYVVEASKKWIKAFKDTTIQGTTVTCAGFYAPQGRQLRYKMRIKDLLSDLVSLNDFKNIAVPITNFEMETSGIYALGKLLGHECMSLSLIVANRKTLEFSKKYATVMPKFIQDSLNIIARNI